MKKILVALFTISLLSGTILKAQDADVDVRGKFSLGLKAGLNYSNVWDEKGQDFKADSRIGFAGGLFLSIPIGKLIGFQPEIMVSQKGFQGSGTLLGFPYTFTKTNTYIDVPLQVQIKPTEFITIVAGPQYSYLLSEQSSYTFGSNSGTQEKEFSNDNIQKNIFGVVGGADLILRHVVLSLRAGMDLQNNNGDGTSTTPRYKNRWLQFTIGFII